MFFIPIGLFSGDTNTIQIPSLFFKNIVPVTIGNICGGFLFSLLILTKFTVSKEKVQ